MNKSKSIIILCLLIVTGLIFFKIFISGLYPIPGNLLAAFYFPFYSGGWEGFNPWTIYKEQFGADAIRQIFLWKNFAINQFKQGELPLWNPYTFSGQPLLANFQSGVFYPFNIFYFIMSAKNAWILMIVSIPFIAGLFTYLFARSLNLNKISALFASISFMFSSYLITWMENGNVMHSYVWMPLALWSVNEYFKNFKLKYIFILILSIAMSILAGHPQTVIYLYLTIILFWIFKSTSSKKNSIKIFSTLIISLGAPLLLTAIQLLPTLDFYKDSPISLPFNAQIFDNGILPYQNLVTFLAPDFFGHPASKNFWSFSYGDFTPYIGVIPFVFALWAIISLGKQKIIKFLTFIVLLFVLSSVSGPITWAIKTFEIPLLNATYPARFISISLLFLTILSAFGFQNLIENIEKKEIVNKFLKLLSAFFLIYILMWLFAVFGSKFLKPSDTWTINLGITKRNLIIPTLMFLTLPIGIFLYSFINRKKIIPRIYFKKILILSIFIVTLYGGLFFSNKYLPTSPKSYLFPEHPLFNWLKNNAGINRFYGGGTARVDFNMPTYYEVYVSEGYDTLRLKRYAELLAAGRNNGIIPESYLRSDAAFSDDENKYRLRLFELLGIKYLLDKEDNPKTGQDWHYENYATDDIFGVWQYEKFLVYERRNVLPRIFMSSKYIVSPSNEDIINKIFDSEFDLQTIILEKAPSIEIDNTLTEIIIPDIERYEPNEIIINTSAPNNNLLFLSDAYAKDWDVYIDNMKGNILRAHYAFRSVEVPKGDHKIVFKYQPKSFEIGLYVTLISLIGFVSILILVAKYKRL